MTHIETRSAEGREFRALVNRGNVGEIFDAALGKRAVDGASAELQKHYGLDANQVPLALLVRSWPDADKLETRAVTPAPGDVGQEQQSIVPYVFPNERGHVPWRGYAYRGSRRKGVPGPDFGVERGNTRRERRARGDHGSISAPTC